MILTNISIILICYLLGTIPSALLLVRLVIRKDLRSEGTGNIGAMNSYDTTGKKWVGTIVFIMDFAKGALAVVFARFLTGDDIYSASLAASFVVLGHNYNLFLKFKGGRGLASAAGAACFINPLAIIFWALMWLTGYYVLKRNVHIGNMVGTIGMIILVFGAPESAIQFFQTMPFDDYFQYKILVLIIGLIIALRHIEPIKKMMTK